MFIRPGGVSTPATRMATTATTVGGVPADASSATTSYGAAHGFRVGLLALFL